MPCLEKSATLAAEDLQVGRVNEDPAVDMLQVVSAQVEVLQVSQLVKDAGCQFFKVKIELSKQ